MDPRHILIDERFVGICVFCGAEPNTRDHVPSKILLDAPLPQNLPVVEACEECNQSFSFDEEYFACFLECVLCGDVNTEIIQREKVKRIFKDKPHFAKELLKSRMITEAGIIWKPNQDRVNNVIIKLAQGHAAYELGLPALGDPIFVDTIPFCYMPPEERNEFESDPNQTCVWPEIGSRAFLRVCGAKPYVDQPGPWIVVQENRYRYSVDQNEGQARVRIVISEYLACEVIWE